MAIRHIETNRTDYNLNTGYANQISEYQELQIINEYKKSGKLPEFMQLKSDKTLYEGLVVAIVTHGNVQIMSDVWADITYAVVYDHEKGFLLYTIANSDFSNAGRITAEIDAPEFLKNAYKLHEAELKYQLDQYNESRRQLEKLARAKEITVNKRVRVVRGRNVPIGTEGVVFWIGDTGQYGSKIGIATTDRKGSVTRNGKTYNNAYLDVVFSYVKNCEVVNPEQYL